MKMKKMTFWHVFLTEEEEISIYWSFYSIYKTEEEEKNKHTCFGTLNPGSKHTGPELLKLVGI